MNDYIPSPEEKTYLENYDPGAWPRPSVTADLMVLAGREEKKLLLVRRGGFPYRGWWALPGGFCEPGEPPEAAAARELSEETGLCINSYGLLGIFGGKDRDPRGWTVTAAFLALTGDESLASAADDAEAALWFSPKLECLSQDDEHRVWELTLSSGDTVLGAVIRENSRFPRLCETGLEIVSRNGIAFDHAKIIAAGLLKTYSERK